MYIHVVPVSIISSSIAMFHHMSRYHHKHQTHLNITQMYWNSIIITALAVWCFWCFTGGNRKHKCPHHHHHHLLVSFKICVHTLLKLPQFSNSWHIWQMDDNLVTMVINRYFSHVEVYSTSLGRQRIWSNCGRVYAEYVKWIYCPVMVTSYRTCIEFITFSYRTFWWEMSDSIAGE